MNLSRHHSRAKATPIRKQQNIFVLDLRISDKQTNQASKERTCIDVTDSLRNVKGRMNLLHKGVCNFLGSRVAFLLGEGSVCLLHHFIEGGMKTKVVSFQKNLTIF